MSYPPPPGQNPNNPYAASPAGRRPTATRSRATRAPVRLPAQGGMPAYPGGTGRPHGTVRQHARAARHGARAALLRGVAVGALLSRPAHQRSGGRQHAERPARRGLERTAPRSGIGLVFFLLLGGLAALHIVPASMFGKGGTGTRVTAIIAASINALSRCWAPWARWATATSRAAGPRGPAVAGDRRAHDRLLLAERRGPVVQQAAH